MNRKFTSTVAGASTIIALATVLSRSIGFLREIIYATIFGLDKNFDIYLVGAVFPTIINSAVYYLSQNYFISAYHKIPSEQKTERAVFFNKSFYVFIFLGAAIALVLFLLKGIIIENYLWNSDQATKEVAGKIFLFFILSIPFNAGYSIIASYLQAELNFTKPAIAQVLLNLPIIILVLILNESLGIYTIGAGYLLGNILQVLYLMYFVRYKLTFNINSAIKKLSFLSGVNSTLVLIILIEIINQLHLVVDRYFYNYVDEGGIAALNYAGVLFLLPITIFSLALSTAIFPKLAESFNKKEWTELERYFSQAFRIISYVFIPLTFIYYFFGSFIISLLFQRGEFSSTDTTITYNVLKMYSLSLFFYSAYALINKMVYSAGLVKQLLSISIILLIVKVITNFLLVTKFKQDGLALSSSVCYALLSLICLYLVYKKISFKNKTKFIAEVVLFTILACFSYFITLELIKIIPINGILKEIINLSVFLLIYLMISYFLNLNFFSPFSILFRKDKM